MSAPRLILLSMLVFQITVWAQPQGDPPFPGTADSRKTTSVTGVVLETQAATPVAGATISIVRSGHVEQRVAADRDGRFEVTDVKPGRVLVTAARPGYVPVRWTAEQPSHLLVLSAGASQDVTLRLERGAVITGTVRDQTGRPLAGQRCGCRVWRVREV